MQDVAKQGDDPQAALSLNGVAAPDSAICYLTPAQLATLVSELEEMELALSYETTAWSVREKLGRARLANRRVEPVKRSW